jgi:hypothetical protein
LLRDAFVGIGKPIAHLVPFVETADGLLLKTIIPSRKATRRTISET